MMEPMLPKSLPLRLSFVALVAVFALLAMAMFSSTPRAQNEAYAEGGEVVAQWMDGFKDVGDNTIVIGGHRDDASQSFALQDLKKRLSEVQVDDAVPFTEPSTLDGASVKIMPGKKYVIFDSYGNEVLSGQSKVA